MLQSHLYTCTHYRCTLSWRAFSTYLILNDIKNLLNSLNKIGTNVGVISKNKFLGFVMHLLIRYYFTNTGFLALLLSSIFTEISPTKEIERRCVLGRY